MLSLLIDGNDYISELIHESLVINQTNDGLNSTCSFEIRDADVIRENIWTVGVTVIGNGDVITGHTVFSNPKVEVSITDGATVYFAGILSRINVGPSGCAQVGDYLEPRNQVLKCYCHDFNQMLEESVVDSLEEYTMTSDELIIDDIFAKYVTGIDFATFVTAVQTYKSISFENITVRQALDQLVERSGAVWYVDYSKKLHYNAAGAGPPAWYLSDVPDQVNSFSYLDLERNARSTDATNLVNMVFVVSSEAGTWFTDEPSRAKYGDHKAIIRDGRLSIPTSIELRGKEILEKFKDPVEVYTVRTYKDGLRAGMNLRFICAYLDVDDTFLINQLQVTFPVDGEPLYELTLGGLESSIGGAARRLDVDQIYSEPPVTSTQLPLASRGWGHDMTFSATDDDTVEWTAGTITTASGQTFSINLGDTDDPGAMMAKTIVYLDTVISLTDLQMTTVETAAIGNNRIMVAVCWPSGVAGVDAGFQVFGATGELATYLNATNVIANCITANEVAANTITGAEIIGTSLSAIYADLGAITAGTITLTQGAGFGTVLLSNTGIGLWDAAANLRIRLSAVDGTFELTTADAGDRMELDVNGLRFYDGADLLIDLNKINATFSMKSSLAGDRVELDTSGLRFYDGADLLIDLSKTNATFSMKSSLAGDRVELDTSGLRFYDGANLLIDLNATNATFSLKSGVAGSARIEISNSEITGYDGADVKQFYLSATTGKAFCGGGVVTLHDDGIDIDMGGDLKNRISFDHSGTERGYIWPKAYSTGTVLAIATGPTTGATHRATMTLNAIPSGGAGTQTGIDLHSPKTGAVGYIGFHADGVTSMTLRDEGPRLGIGRHIEFDDALNYLYKDASDDLYWKKDGVAAVKLN